jgi:succinate dehydrogenase / fumarate reductase cytochrome b subunit
LLRLFHTSIGSKLLVAATGTALIGFLFVHAAGNLLILKGADSLNAYADWLHGHPLLWVFRAGLVLLFAVHISVSIRLARESSAARPVRYRRISRLGTRLPGRLMRISGGLLLVFLVFHILHLTVRNVGPVVEPLHDASGRVDVYGMLILGFCEPWLVAIYVAAMLMLALHLVHAVESLFQTLGFNHDSYQPLIRVLAPLVGLVIAGAFAAIPLLIYAGFIGAGG